MNSAFTACKADFCYYKTTKKVVLKLIADLLKILLCFLLLLLFLKLENFDLFNLNKIKRKTKLFLF